MNDGKHCPACGVDIGVWPLFLAGLPNRIRCPKCKVRLAYQESGIVYGLLLLIVLISLAVSYYMTLSLSGNQRLVAFSVAFLGTCVPIELLGAIYLRKNKTLKCQSDDE